MAWLDNSQRVYADEREFVQPASDLRHSNNQYTGKWSSYYLFPVFKILFNWYHVIALSQKSLKLLNGIEKRIVAAQFENENLRAVIHLLREIMQVKKHLSPLSKDIATNHPLHPGFYLKKFIGRVLSRSEQLKKALIKKSHQSLFNPEISETHCTSLKMKGSSHLEMLTLMEKHQIDHSRPKEKLPSRVYWRYAHNEIFANSYNSGANKNKQSLIYLQTSCDHLANLLTKKEALPEFYNPNHLRLCDKGFNTTDQKRVCGISLKLSPSFDNPQKDALVNTTFWHQRPLRLDPSLLSKMDFRNLKEQIIEIFFQTVKHYQDFKQLLLSNQNTELLSLIDSLEAEQQILIPTQEPGSFFESGLKPAN